MKILISGGHLTPALAFIEYVQKESPETELVFVGRLFTQNNVAQKSQEKLEIGKRKVKFIPFNSGKSSSSSITSFGQQAVLFCKGLIQSWSIFQQEKPTIYLSFGGYLAPPLAIIAKIRGIRIVTHEQTRTLGRATRFVGMLAEKIALSYPLDNLPFSSQKVTVTGNPIRPILLNKKHTQPSWLENISTKPLLYITGGNQGSQVINMTVAQALPQLCKDWWIIHQCGQATSQLHYSKELHKIRGTLTPHAQRRYVVREWISDQDLAWIYAHATAVVSRAGANTVQELHVVAVPSVLIPLPFSHSNEQLENAKILEKIGGAIILEQQHLTPEKLTSTLGALLRKQHLMRTKLEATKPTHHSRASQNLFEVITAVANR